MVDMTTYSQLTTTHPMWIPAAVKAATQGNAKQLYKPPGYEKCGYSLNYMVRSDHSVRWSLSYRFGKGKYTGIATWLTDWLPLDKVRNAQRPVTPPDKPIRITSEGCDWPAQVVLDHLGLPWPVPSMSDKERTARALADILLDGGHDTWTAENVFAFIEADGWRWNGNDWKQRPEKVTT